VIYRGPGFLAVIRFNSPPFPFSKLERTATYRKTKKERQITDRRRGDKRWGRSQIIRRQESLVLYKSVNILWEKQKATQKYYNVVFTLTGGA
jgi:hypothetical protein